MSVVQISTNFNIDIEFESPPFYRRLLAWVIDLLIQFFYLILAIRFLNWLEANLKDSVDNRYNMHWMSLIVAVPFLVYHLVSEITMGGQSVGKKIMGIKVISENGGKPSFGQYAIRWLIRTADLFIFIIIILLILMPFIGLQIRWGLALALGLLIADIILANTRKQQRLGDILAHTLLINTRQRENINDTIFLEISDKYIPSFPQVMQLSDRDINSLKGILDTARRRGDYNLAEMASEKIKNHLHIQTTLSAFDFLEVLLKDYNYLSSN